MVVEDTMVETAETVERKTEETEDCKVEVWDRLAAAAEVVHKLAETVDCTAAEVVVERTLQADEGHTQVVLVEGHTLEVQVVGHKKEDCKKVRKPADSHIDKTAAAVVASSSSSSSPHSVSIFSSNLSGQIVYLVLS